MRKILTLLALLFPLAAFAAPSIRYSAVGTYAGGTGVSTFTVSLGAGNYPQAGDTVCALIPYKDNATPGFSGVTDGTTAYTQAIASASYTTNGNAEIWCLQNITTQSSTYSVTATATTANSLSGDIVLIDWQGVPTASIDQSGFQSANAATLSPTATAPNTTSTDAEMAVVAVPNNAGSATNVPAGWTALQNDYAGTGSNALTVVYKIASATETTGTTFTWTTAQFSGSVALSLKGPAGFSPSPVLSNGHPVLSNGHPLL